MNTDKLKEVLSIQTYSHNQVLMFEYIIKELERLNIPHYVDNDNIYATKGEAKLFPCVVAHMDTVHEIVEDLTVLEVNGNLTGFNTITIEQTGIGGDDKVGVFIVLECLEYFDDIKVAFFRDEEVGCQGSYEADLDFFDDCNIVLQCDRRGNGDFITNASGTELSSKDFQKDIKGIISQYGYKFANGMMTDVMALKEIGVLASMANISCGYYNPHSYNEYVNIKDVANCLELVKHIIYQTQGNVYNITPKKKEKINYSTKYAYNDWASNWADWDFKTKDSGAIVKKKYKTTDEHDVIGECDSCAYISELKYNEDYHMNICADCAEFLN
jgi:tripeptide aminopeptidase